ncbi:hypothetical protein L596_010776 [Steinernema carpocapsae]|uniref:Uncharacterized protein n=1 Tax=Steinernema carpocapsae TaxID=34508 RepID=A0A4U5PJI8_STECR|nr:hypothetical protein L596_010776 [Steinernema carpocapsae]
MSIPPTLWRQASNGKSNFPLFFCFVNRISATEDQRAATQTNRTLLSRSRSRDCLSDNLSYRPFRPSLLPHSFSLQ